MSDCIFDGYDRFQKGAKFNRCTLSGPNGVVNLSIPIKGGREQKAILKDLKIDYRELWQVRHWRTITSCYNRSPWFEYFRHELEELYHQRPSFLVDWNFLCTKWACDKMSVDTRLTTSDSFVQEYGDGYIDCRLSHRQRHPELELHSTLRYPQVFEDRHGFLPDLSVLDYLFCTGNKIR